MDLLSENMQGISSALVYFLVTGKVVSAYLIGKDVIIKGDCCFIDKQGKKIPGISLAYSTVFLEPDCAKRKTAFYFSIA